MSWLSRIQSRSISILAIQAGGCRGCSLQFSIALSQDSEIKGITVVSNPKHADALLITGCINEKTKAELLRLYDLMPGPKAVIAAGACSCSGSLFHTEDSGLHPAEQVLPVDAWIRGCTPEPEAILKAVVQAVELSYQKVKQ